MSAQLVTFPAATLRDVSMDEEDRRRERDAKECWYDVRGALGEHNGLAHKVKSFLVPWGKMETICGRSVYAAYPTRVTDRPEQFRTNYAHQKCRRCAAEISSGRWVYP